MFLFSFFKSLQMLLRGRAAHCQESRSRASSSAGRGPEQSSAPPPACPPGSPTGRSITEKSRTPGATQRVSGARELQCRAAAPRAPARYRLGTRGGASLLMDCLECTVQRTSGCSLDPRCTAHLEREMWRAIQGNIGFFFHSRKGNCTKLRRI